VSRDSEGRDIFVVDAQRDGRRFVVRADEKLTAFAELESAIRSVSRYKIKSGSSQRPAASCQRLDDM
jgi:hypothetical protein